MKNNFFTLKFIMAVILIFILLDLFVGKYIYNKFIRDEFVDVDSTFGLKDDVYDHKFKSSYNTLVGWGKYRYRFCTDVNGFRSSCENQFDDTKTFDIAFIGDSFTEPVGISFEKSFVGIISSNLKNKKIANLSAASYSPSIYYSKINYLLSQGYKFNEVIVFIDLSDIVDDSLCYKLEKNKVVRRDSYLNCYEQKINSTERISNFIKRKLKFTYESYKLIMFGFKKIGVVKYKVPFYVTNHPRSDWTHNYNKENYNNFSYKESTDLLIENMEKLSQLLKNHKIKLSIATYPWPGTLKYDIANNKHLMMWKNFCVTNCKIFYDFMKPFYDILNKEKFTNVYRKIYIENDQHFNEIGHKIIAENFLKLYKD